MVHTLNVYFPNIPFSDHYFFFFYVFGHIRISLYHSLAFISLFDQRLCELLLCLTFKVFFWSHDLLWNWNLYFFFFKLTLLMFWSIWSILKLFNHWDEHCIQTPKDLKFLHWSGKFHLLWCICIFKQKCMLKNNYRH